MQSNLSLLIIYFKFFFSFSNNIIILQLSGVTTIPH